MGEQTKRYPGPRVKDTETFILKAMWRHGSLYDYSLASYKAAKLPISIVCKEHGIFEQVADKHLSGRGCPKCKLSKIGERCRSNTEDFVEKAIKIHGDKYDYSLVNYKRAVEKVSIVCSAHGVFHQVPNSHLNGNGCPSCGKLKQAKTRRKTTTEFIREATQVHGERYEYSQTDYTHGEENVKIVCRTHGVFHQRPTVHLNGSGCPSCGDERRGWGSAGFYGSTENSNFYILRMTGGVGEEFLKIGLSNNTDIRLSQIRRCSSYSPKVIFSLGGVANELFEFEQKLIHQSDFKKYTPLHQFSGHTECFENEELPGLLAAVNEYITQDRKVTQ